MSKLVVEITAYSAGLPPVTFRDEAEVFPTLPADIDDYDRFVAQKKLSGAKVKKLVAKLHPEYANGAHSFGYVEA